MLRWNDATCALEESSDGGATWAAVSGWDIEGLAKCLQQPLIDIGGTPGTGVDGPGNPGGISDLVQACNIAGWLGVQILQGSMSSIGSSLAADATLLETADNIFKIAASWSGVGGLFFQVMGLLIPAAAAIGETALNTAAGDAGLRADLICAIYSAISAAGKVTPGNFPTIVANIGAISYGTPTIVGLLHDYVNHLGYDGLNAIQSEGSLFGGDCSACGGGAPVGFNCIESTNAATIKGLCGADWVIGGGAFTLGGWVSGAGANDTFAEFGYNGVAGAAAAEFGTLSGSYFADLRTNSGPDQVIVDGAPSAGVTHIVFSSDGSGGTQRLYINGSLAASGAAQSGTINSSGALFTFFADYLHRGLSSGAKMWGWAAYASQLTAPQVATWFAAGTSTSPPLGTYAHYWPMNEGSGAVAHDVAGHNDAALSGGYTWSTHS